MTGGAPIRLLIVDDHAMFREGITAIIAPEADMTIIGEASNGAEAVEAFRKLRPDVTLMDLQMPEMSGVDAITEIRAAAPTARVIVLTTLEGDMQAMRALKAGAAGYLLKSSLRRELLDTIRTVHAGKRFVLPQIAQEIALHAAEDPLTAREIAILDMVAAGKANKLIAWELSLSEDTVKSHLRSIYAKLDVNDRTQAVTVALRRGIISL
ncbi:response regulator [Sphingoaurantiacus capsulatus]|uniref:Response regulator n=1 Tax=Sphingoaurantiacus capsulatus TaxID=1771310 RepID=A0ABV7X510_9SPHN